MKRKIVITLCAGLSCCMLMSGCGNKSQDPLTGETTPMTSTEDTIIRDDTMSDDFDSLLSNASSYSEITGYINENIMTATAHDIERFFKGLFGFPGNIRDIDYEELAQNRQYLTEDMIAFMDLMRLEKEAPSMIHATNSGNPEIGLTLSEMLERALLFEQHIEKYPNAASTEPAKQIYEEIVTAAISGGYDSITGIPHYYQGATADVVDEKALTYYQMFADANPDTRLGQLVREYIALLQQHNFKINSELEDFYRNIHERLIFDTDTTSTTERSSEITTDMNMGQENTRNQNRTQDNMDTTNERGTNDTSAAPNGLR